MLATLTDAPFDDRNWIFEDKYDGFRMVAEIEGGKVTLYSRNGKMISGNYLEIAKALEAVKGDAVIDGELVALDTKGVSHFQLLQNALRKESEIEVLRVRPHVHTTERTCATCHCSRAKSGFEPFCRVIT